MESWAPATSATSSNDKNETAHVVELLDFYPKGNALVMVLELCAGGDLGALLGVAPRASGPSVACAKSVAAQILRGVAACHAIFTGLPLLSVLLLQLVSQLS